LRELRATLGVLRQVDEAEPLTPAPGLERLHDLVADTAAGGLQVDVSVIGTPRALPPGVDLAACRVTVRIAYEADGLLLQVADDGAAPVRDGVTGGNGDGRGGGHGIQGMRERATAVGGRLDAGHLPEGGFRVQARLPLEPGA
jgi:hypothetical protein